MRIIAPIRHFVSYLAGKTSEIQSMDVKDAVMAKVILEIHRTRTHKLVTSVPLYSIKPIHKLNRKTALQTVEERSETLRQNRSALLLDRQITSERLADLMPSVSWIKVVQSAPTEYLAFEGNGRLAAMKNVFDPSDEMMVEVENYHFKNTGKVLRKLARIRKMNNLIDDDL